MAASRIGCPGCPAAGCAAAAAATAALAARSASASDTAPYTCRHAQLAAHAVVPARVMSPLHHGCAADQCSVVSGEGRAPGKQLQPPAAPSAQAVQMRLLRALLLLRRSWLQSLRMQQSLRVDTTGLGNYMLGSRAWRSLACGAPTAGFGAVWWAATLFSDAGGSMSPLAAETLVSPSTPESSSPGLLSGPAGAGGPAGAASVSATAASSLLGAPESGTALPPPASAPAAILCCSSSVMSQLVLMTLRLLAH